MTKRGSFSYLCPFVQPTNCPLAQWHLLFPTVQYWHTMDNTNLYFESRMMAKPSRATTRANTLQIRRFASQTKPLQACHPERSEGSLSGERSFAALRMTSLMVSYL